jgi:hypothetical protein
MALHQRAQVDVDDDPGPFSTSLQTSITLTISRAYAVQVAVRKSAMFWREASLRKGQHGICGVRGKMMHFHLLCM